jgi:hypothetical protein
MYDTPRFVSIEARRPDATPRMRYPRTSSLGQRGAKEQVTLAVQGATPGHPLHEERR